MNKVVERSQFLQPKKIKYRGYIICSYHIYKLEMNYTVFLQALRNSQLLFDTYYGKILSCSHKAKHHQFPELRLTGQSLA